MDTVIRTGDPADILTYIPYRLGFRPRESIVLLGLRPPRGRLGLVMRLDIAHVADEQQGAAILDEARELMAFDGSTDAFVVLYTDIPWQVLGERADVVRAVRRVRELTTWCEAPGPWVVGDECYGVWGSTDSCAPLRTPTARLDYGAMAARLVVEGLSVLPDRKDLAIPPTTDPAVREAATRAYRRTRRRRHGLLARQAGAPGIEPVVELAAWQRRQHHLWVRLLARGRAQRPIGAGELGRLLAGFEDVLLRDAAMCAAIGALPDRLPTMREIDHLFATAMGTGTAVPAPERLDPVTAVLRQAAAAVGASAGAAPALGMLAWLAWWAGDGARAEVLADQCLALDPELRLALLVQQAVEHRLAPLWVHEKTATA